MEHAYDDSLLHAVVVQAFIEGYRSNWEVQALSLTCSLLLGVPVSYRWRFFYQLYQHSVATASSGCLVISHTGRVGISIAVQAEYSVFARLEEKRFEF